MTTTIKEMKNLTPDEKKAYKSSGYYRGKNRCVKLRQHDLQLTSEKNAAYDTAVTEKDILKNIFEGNFGKDELKDLVSQGVEDRFKAQEVTRDLSRYIKSETRVPKIAHTKFFLIGDEKVRVKPDFIFDDGNTIEIVFMRSSRPDVTMRGKKNDTGVNQSLELWYGLIYGRAYREEMKEENRNIKSSYYFIRKDTDKAFGLYDTDFFSNSGKNVVFLYEGYDEKGINADDMNSKFFPQLEAFSEGTECTPDDCKTCMNRTSCEYQKSPEPFEKKENKKNGKITLSDAQASIVAFRKGVARVIAKAGSGKTECSTERTAQMYAEGVDPSSFLSITFTDAGANEMKERITKKCESRGLGIAGDDILAMTFHKFGLNIIRDNYKMFGFTKAPQIVDTDDVKKKRLFDNLLIDDDLYTLQNRFSLLDWAIKVHTCIKNNEIDIDSDSAPDLIQKELDNNFMSYQDIENLIEIARKFDAQLKENNLLTFADIEPMMNQVLREKPEYLEGLGIKHILVDEFQDSNDAQMETIRLLVSTKCFESLMVVGDDSQSIYGFRNTSQENILHFFEKLGVAGTDFRLDENRRSTEEILSFANRIDALNKNRAGGDMVAVRGGGFKPVVRAYWNRDEEYDFIVDQITKGIASKRYVPEEFAIIAYKKSELVAIAGKLSKAGIPWVTKYPMPLADNSRVQAAISLASAFYQPDAENLYFNYLVALNDGDIFEDMTNDEIKAKVAELKSEWMGMDMLEIPYQRKLFHDKLEAIKGNDEIYQAFLDLLYENEDLQSELEFIVDFRKYGDTVAKKLENDYAGVVLTTAHSSKGLEWPVVFNTISGYDNKFLHKGGAKAAAEVEERRRLLYVSVTRARDILYVTGQYVAYGNYSDYTYNQFLREAMECAYVDYNPVKPVKSSSKTSSKPKSREMTEEEKEQYRKQVANSRQMTLAEVI